MQRRLQAPLFGIMSSSPTSPSRRTRTSPPPIRRSSSPTIRKASACIYLNGGQHETSQTDPNQYNISTFASTDLPIQTGTQDEPRLGRSDTPILALSLPELWRLGNMPDNARTR